MKDLNEVVEEIGEILEQAVNEKVASSASIDVQLLQGVYDLHHFRPQDLRGKLDVVTVRIYGAVNMGVDEWGGCEVEGCNGILLRDINDKTLHCTDCGMVVE